MIVSKYLIGKFLPKIHTIDDQQFIDACGAIGIEVERVIKHPKTNNLVIGQIIKVSQHPNADKLHVCEVKIDNSNNVNNIVCGANNVAEKKKVIVALSGAKLYDGRLIEYKELRGVLSQGMICAYNELTPHNLFQAPEDADGIILLDDAIVGDTAIEKYIGLDDTIYELTVPSNRNDLNGVLSLCQELTAYFKWEFIWPKADDFKGTFSENISLTYDEHIADGIAVIKIKDIAQTKSSWLLKSLLMNNGVRPINNTLDRLAYVTLLTNVPTAIYDASKIGTSLEAVRANEKDSVVGFDDKSYKLSPHDIVIRSNGSIIGIGGILGAKEFGISNSTKDIIIEVANFNYANIRNTATRLDIKTDAARRFAKVMPNYLIKLALHSIYEQFSGYQVSHPIISLKAQQQIKVNVDFNYINHILGVKLQPDIIKANLRHLGYEFEGDVCLVPLHRLDIKTSQDISEEVVKFLNVNELPIEPVIGIIDTTHPNTEHQLISKMKAILNANYFNEVKTYNLTNEVNLKPFNIFKYSKFIKIENAHNAERSFLRTNSINELLNVYQYNSSYKTKLSPIFEVQKIYANTIAETNLTMLTTSLIDLDRIGGSKIVMNVNVLKGIANDIASLFNTNFEYFTTSDSSVFYSNELLAVQCQGKLIGYIGSIKSSCLKPFDLQSQIIYCLTLNIDMLIKLYIKPTTKFASINNLMPIYKDISFIIHPLKKITNLLEALTKIDFIESYEFIDRYVINEEQISYNIRFRFNNVKGLDTKTIDTYLKEIEKQMVENHATVRK